MAMIFNSLIFGNIDSADYGIYITGEAVYNAPERAVEMVTVPGRNGALALDQGRWENIEVSYPAGCFGADQSDFASKISDFRNAVCSQLGYQRLTDTYNPNEYRLGVYASGLDVKPASMNRAGEFTISFDCKPQRFLTSGETEETVSDGETLTNPTQYEAKPLLMVEGPGTIQFNGFSIVIEAVTLGNIVLVPSKQLERSITFDNSLVNPGDAITLQSLKAPVYHSFNNLVSGAWSLGTSTDKTNADCAGFNVYVGWDGLDAYASFDISKISFVAGTAGNIVANCEVYATVGGTSYQNIHRLKVSYDGIDTISITWAIDSGTYSDYIAGTFGETRAISSVSALGHPTYIDCDLGECYMIKNDNIVSLNGVISLGSDLPTLAPGDNEITFDNTITELKVTPRWYKL